jgi:hypothetical protein
VLNGNGLFFNDEKEGKFFQLKFTDLRRSKALEGMRYNKFNNECVICNAKKRFLQLTSRGGGGILPYDYFFVSGKLPR